MTGVVEAAAVTILVVLVGGVIVVVIGLSAWAIWREDQRLTLTECPPNWLSAQSPPPHGGRPAQHRHRTRAPDQRTRQAITR